MKRNSILRDDHGAVAVLVIVVLAAFLGILALVVDLGHLHTVQNELWNAADACALRGARAYVPDNVTGVSNTDPDPSNAMNQASATINVNKSDNVALTDLPLADIQVGIWNYETHQLMAWQWPPDASLLGHYIGPGVSVFTKRAESLNTGPVGMSLAKIFGINMVPVGTKATAALSGVGGLYPGSPVLPFGTWVNKMPAKIGDTLLGEFRNDPSDTMGWTNLDPNMSNTSANDIKTIFKNGALYEVLPGDNVTIQNGVASSAIKAMTAPNNMFGLVQNPPGSNIYTPLTDTVNPKAPNGETYANTIYFMPLFDKTGENNPDTFNQSGFVGGFPVFITEVRDSPDNTILITRAPGDYIMPGHGGGPWYGVLATEPKLVK